MLYRILNLFQWFGTMPPASSRLVNLVQVDDKVIGRRNMYDLYGMVVRMVTNQTCRKGRA
jgi:hypothetical protein